MVKISKFDFCGSQSLSSSDGYTPVVTQIKSSTSAESKIALVNFANSQFFAPGLNLLFVELTLEPVSGSDWAI
jgi:hypothetical protein